MADNQQDLQTYLQNQAAVNQESAKPQPIKDLGTYLQQTGQLDDQPLDPKAAPTVIPSSRNGLSEETPMLESPLSFTERLQLSVGNEAGRLSFLKKTYEDAKVNKDGQLVVKQGGLWRAADPDGWGTAESISGKGAEFLADLVDIAPDIAEMITVGAAGTAGSVGGPAGTVAAATAAAAATSAAKSSLGRWAGTYEATPEEELADIALDSVLTAGGYAIMPAAKGLKALGGAVGKKLGVQKVATKPDANFIWDGIKSATRRVEKSVVGAYLTATGMPAASADTIAHNADAMNGLVRRGIGMIRKGKTKTELKAVMEAEAGSLVDDAAMVGSKGVDKLVNITTRATVFPEWENVVISPGQLSNQFLNDILRPVTKWDAGKKKFVAKKFSELSEDVKIDLGTNAPQFLAVMSKIGAPMLNIMRQGKQLKGQEAVKFMSDVADVIGDAKVLSGKKTGEALKVFEEFLTKGFGTQVARQSPKAWEAWQAREAFRKGARSAINDLSSKTLFGSASTQASTLNQLAGTSGANAINQILGKLDAAMASHPSSKQAAQKLLRPMYDKINQAQQRLATQHLIGIMPNIGLVQGGLIAGFALDTVVNGRPSTISAASTGALMLTSPAARRAAVRNLIRFGEVAPNLAGLSGEGAKIAADTLRATKGQLLLTNPALRADVLKASIGALQPLAQGEQQ